MLGVPPEVTQAEAAYLTYEEMANVASARQAAKREEHFAGLCLAPEGVQDHNRNAAQYRKIATNIVLSARQRAQQ